MCVKNDTLLNDEPSVKTDKLNAVLIWHTNTIHMTYFVSKEHTHLGSVIILNKLLNKSDSWRKKYLHYGAIPLYKDEDLNQHCSRKIHHFLPSAEMHSMIFQERVSPLVGLKEKIENFTKRYDSLLYKVLYGKMT